MRKLGDILKEARQSKHITKQEAAKKLLLKEEIIDSLEEGNWNALPEPAYVKGFIRNYAQFLDLEPQKLQALYRAEFDEKNYPKKTHYSRNKKRFMFTPEKIMPTVFVVAIVTFLVYLTIQYTSILSAPKLQVFSPQDNITITTPIIEVSGRTQNEATVSVSGEIISVDSSGNFNHQITLEEGRNIIEVVASYRFSPKTKITRVVRLSR